MTGADTQGPRFGRLSLELSCLLFFSYFLGNSRNSLRYPLLMVSRHVRRTGRSRSDFLLFGLFKEDAITGFKPNGLSLDY